MKAQMARFTEMDMNDALSSPSDARARVLKMAQRYFQQQLGMGLSHIYAPPLTRSSRADGAERIKELFHQIKDCTACSLHKTRTHFVFGEGQPTAPIVFIGEAPGRDEDLQGRPFVGRAGQLLTKMLAAIKFRREDVFIGNILKCRPPNNRDPLPAEIQSCEPHLHAQLAIIQPSLICALGRIAAQTLLKTTAPLSRLRGKIHDYLGIGLIATYHPAALLRNPQLKRGAWDDLQLLRREHDRLSEELSR
jgi:DNA polymerase